MIKAEFSIPTLQDVLASVIPAASTDAERPSMNAVCFDIGKVHAKLIATDGTWAAERAIELVSVDSPGRIAIPLYCAKKLVAMMADEVIGNVLLVSDATLCRFDIPKVGRVDCDPVTNFPPVDDHWPKGDGTRMSRVGMSPKLLAKIGKAFGCSKGQGIHFIFHGENSPILIQSESVPEMRALLMPMRQLSMDFDGADDAKAKLGDKVTVTFAAPAPKMPKPGKKGKAKGKSKSGEARA